MSTTPTTALPATITTITTTITTAATSPRHLGSVASSARVQYSGSWRVPHAPAWQALAAGGGHLRGALAHWLAAAVAARASSSAPRAVGRSAAPLGCCL
eukprot:15444397-Alexandrium_andersonii.AAC.1